MLRKSALVMGTASALDLHFLQDSDKYKDDLPAAAQKVLRFLGSLGMSETDLGKSLSLKLGQLKFKPAKQQDKSKAKKMEKKKSKQVEKKNNKDANSKKSKKSKKQDDDDEDESGQSSDGTPAPAPKKRARKSAT